MSAGSGQPEHVVLVDDQDRPRGTMEKMEAHSKGMLHRAFSLFLFDASGRTLLQQRASGKYHSGGLWTNACCGHPRPGEELMTAVIRRCQEELGATVEPVHQFTFRYHAHFPNGMQEHEIDHVFFAMAPSRFEPDPAEVGALRWIEPAALTRELDEHPFAFTAWLLECWPSVLQRQDRSGERA